MGFDGAPSLPDRSLRECPAGDMAEVEVVGEEGVVVARVTTRQSGRDPRGTANPAAATAPAVGSGSITGTRRYGWSLWIEGPNEIEKASGGTHICYWVKARIISDQWPTL